MGEWIPDVLFRQISDELLIDPLTTQPPPIGMVVYAGHSDWFTTGLLPRPDGWCEDRDPRTDWGLTDANGRD